VLESGEEAAAGSPVPGHSEAPFANVLSSSDLVAKCFCNVRSTGDCYTRMKI